MTPFKLIENLANIYCLQQKAYIEKKVDTVQKLSDEYNNTLENYAVGKTPFYKYLIAKLSNKFDFSPHDHKILSCEFNKKGYLTLTFGTTAYDKKEFTEDGELNQKFLMQLKVSSLHNQEIKFSSGDIILEFFYHDKTGEFGAITLKKGIDYQFDKFSISSLHIIPMSCEKHKFYSKTYFPSNKQKPYSPK